MIACGAVARAVLLLRLLIISSNHIPLCSIHTCRAWPAAVSIMHGYAAIGRVRVRGGARTMMSPYWSDVVSLR